MLFGPTTPRPPARQRLIDSVNDLKSSPAGRQVLAVFQSDDLKQQPVATLETALDLIATHKKLAEEKHHP